MNTACSLDYIRTEIGFPDLQTPTYHPVSSITSSNIPPPVYHSRRATIPHVLTYHVRALLLLPPPVIRLPLLLLYASTHFTPNTTKKCAIKEEEVAPVAAAAALDFLSSPDRTGSRFPGLRVVLAAEEGSAALKALRDHVPVLAEAKHET